ncbi:hypothetical protein C7421_112122 [Pantoea ananatis]|nr:hypothetical protein C7421_112122 [Pantoea ananatis]
MSLARQHYYLQKPVTEDEVSKFYGLTLISTAFTSLTKNQSSEV